MAKKDARLFEFSDGKSDKFWSISLSGSSHTVNYGRTGTDGQTKTKDFDSGDEAEKSYEKLIAQKVKKGYKEVAVADSRTTKVKETKAQSKAELAAHKPFLDAIKSDPDDLSNYQVYSDWLSENGNPRGELMAMQLQLESPKLAAPARKKLASAEKKLLKSHASEWIGAPLSDYLVDQKQGEELEDERNYQFTFARGFLDTITFGLEDQEFAKVMSKADVTMVRRITIADVFYDDDGACFDILAKGKYDNCRYFTVGDDYYPQGTENAEKMLKKMPLIEEINFNSTTRNGSQIFKLKMPKLRSISLEAGYDYPIEVLAKNKSLENLETLFIFPHMLEPGDDEPYVSLDSWKKFCKAKHFTSLKSITIRCTEFGNEGMEALVKAPFFSQLEELNLSNGTIQEEGAMLFAEQDLSNFKTVDFSSNYIPKAGISAIKAKVKKFLSDSQFSGEVNTDEREHLWEGSME